MRPSSSTPLALHGEKYGPLDPACPEDTSRSHPRAEFTSCIMFCSNVAAGFAARIKDGAFSSLDPLWHFSNSFSIELETILVSLKYVRNAKGNGNKTVKLSPGSFSAAGRMMVFLGI